MIEGQPIRWQLCFDPEAQSRIALMIPGRFKHVRAFGFVPVQDVWIFYDVTMAGTVLRAARNNSAAADRLLWSWTRGCEVLGIAPQGISRLPKGFWCVTAMKHLIGLNTGALRPDALYRDCLAKGAQTLDEGPVRTATASCSAA
jgi:hypothetical protein